VPGLIKDRELTDQLNAIGSMELFFSTSILGSFIFCSPSLSYHLTSKEVDDQGSTTGSTNLGPPRLVSVSTWIEVAQAKPTTHSATSMHADVSALLTRLPVVMLN
jgi:hypothetical protein